MKNFVIKKLKSTLHKLSGSPPLRRGYDEYKEFEIIRTIDSPSTINMETDQNYGAHLDERIIEYPWLFKHLPSEKGQLLDAGSALNFDYILSHNKLKNKQIHISTLAPESTCYWKDSHSYIFQDLRDTCYKDDYFDYIVSLSTIEHIGMDNSIHYTKNTEPQSNSGFVNAIKEFKRILKPHGHVFITVPFGKNNKHDWLQVFDSKMIDEIKKTFQPQEFKDWYFTYKNNHWEIAKKENLVNSLYYDWHNPTTVDFKNRPVAAESVACIHMIK